MKIVILSSWGGGLSLGWRLAKEGHQVRMWIDPKSKEMQSVGDGFLPKIKSWEESVSWGDFFIIDDGGMGGISEKLKAQKKVVWGGNKWSDDIELDRGHGQKALKDAGIPVIPSQEFSKIDEAINLVKSRPGRYVVKPSGPIQDEKTLSYVGKEESGADMISMLEQYKAKWSSKIKSIEIQEFKKGVEVGISGFFNGKDFIQPIEISFEHKKLMNGNIGPSTGEMGTSMLWTRKRKIYKETIGKMVPQLQKQGYIGYLDINCIADEKGIWPLEFTTRFGYPTIHLKMETIRGNMGDMMYGVATGSPKNFTISSPYSICVVLATPPYPFNSEEIYKKISEDQQIFFKTKDRTGIWPGEVLRDKDNNWFITGVSGFTAICTGSGKSIDDARKVAYKRVESVTIPNVMYRTDIGEKTDENLKKLDALGYFS